MTVLHGERGNLNQLDILVIHLVSDHLLRSRKSSNDSQTLSPMTKSLRTSYRTPTEESQDRNSPMSCLQCDVKISKRKQRHDNITFRDTNRDISQQKSSQFLICLKREAGKIGRIENQAPHGNPQCKLYNTQDIADVAMGKYMQMT